MGTGMQKPPSRRELASELALGAAAKPLNIGLLLVVAAGGLAVGAPAVIAVAVAVLIYLVACTRTFFDADEADKLAERRRTQRRRALQDSQPKVDLGALAPEIAQPVREAYTVAERIRMAIEQAQLPYTEVSEAVDSLLELMEASARRAQLLDDGLRDTPVEGIERRIAQLQGSGKTELLDALAQQLKVQQKMQAQLGKFTDQMERVVVELETIRGNLLSVSASTDASNQQRIAEEVRSLRDEVGLLSTSMSDAFEQGRAVA
jgi:hypothetical protein